MIQIMIELFVAYRDTSVANYPKVLMLLLQTGTSTIGTPGSPDNVASSTISNDGQLYLAYSSHNSKFLITYPASNQIKSNILFISNAGQWYFYNQWTNNSFNWFTNGI